MQQIVPFLAVTTFPCDPKQVVHRFDVAPVEPKM